jgi:tetratricopeptide (TPR) repeat protein
VKGNHEATIFSSSCFRVFVVAFFFVVISSYARAQAPAPSSRILVMPFENVTGDSRIFWLAEASSILLADDLNALGANAITREERRQAFERLQVPPAAELSDATVIRIGQLVGASHVVVGTLALDAASNGAALVVRARDIALEPGRVQADIVERGIVPELFAVFARVARRIAPAYGAASGDAELQHPPIAAFESYIKGLLAETPATATAFLRSALTLAPAFDRARLALWDVYAEQGDHVHALDAVRPVPADSTWARRARFLAGLSELNLAKYDEAFTSFKSLADAKPTAAVLNALGVVQLRRGAVTPQSGQPAYYFNKAAEADPDEPDYLFNLGYAYWLNRDPQAAIYWLRETLRRNPTDGDAHFVLGAALAAGDNPAEAAREKELAKRLSSTYEAWDKRPAAEAVPKGLERLKSDVELPHDRRIEATLATNERRDQRELATFYLDHARRLFQDEHDREAQAELNRALYVSPYDADAHLLLGRIHLRNGRVREAIDALKISIWSRDAAPAHIVLGEAYLQAKDMDAARREAERALTLDPASTEAKRLLEKVGPKDPPPC